MTSTYILVAVADPVIHPEATHIAAATGHGVIDTCDPREITRLLPRAHAVLVDAATARHIATLDQRPGVHFLAADPGPVDWQQALHCHAENAYVLPAQAPDLLTALGHAAAPDTPTTTAGAARHGTIIAVTGSAGGCGVSTLAAAMARVAAGSNVVTLIDACPHSGGLDLLLGLEETTGARWPDLRLGDGVVAAADLRAALPTTRDGIAVLSAARSTIADPFRLTPQALAPVLSSLAATDGVSILDLPSSGTVTDTVLDACDRVTLLIPAEVGAAASAAGLVADLTARRTAVSGILRNRDWSGLSEADVEKITRCQVIARLNTIPRLARSIELGGLPARLPGMLSAAARLALEDAGVTL